MSARWSYTRLATYERCPAAYRFRYIDGEPGKPTEALLRGQAVHEFAENYARHCLERKVETDLAAAEELMASYPDEVRALCRQFVETTMFDWSLIVADGQSVEREFEVELPNDAGILVGRVDLVQWNEYEGSLIVTDYKSGWAPPKPDECPPQLQCYAWAMREVFPAATHVIAIARYLGSNTLHDWHLFDPRPDWALSLIRRIEGDTRFSPTPSPVACAYCDYTHLCPLVQADPVTTIADEQQAEECLAQIVATEARLTELRNALKAWTQEHGEIIAYGKRAGPLPPIWYEHNEEYVPRDGLRREEIGQKLREVGIDDKAIRKLWPEPKFDAKAAGKLLRELEAEEDPFGTCEADPRLETLRTLLQPREWDGRTRFRIDNVREESL